MEETELQKAWREFIITLGEELKLYKLLDWLSEKLNKM
jgi:hypothetical protein